MLVAREYITLGYVDAIPPQGQFQIVKVIVFLSFYLLKNNFNF
jgi:hypothetical protein